jgi:uncharacterized membrane protein YphA (DoxX/SURF4 family)
MANVFTMVVRVGFGFLFLACGWSKFLRAQSVGRMVENYRLVSPRMLPFVKRMLAPVEVLAGALMLISLWLPVYDLAWTLAVALLLAFSIAVGSALVRGLKIPCGCGLLLNGHVITRAALGRNLALLSLLLLDVLTQRSPGQ